MEKELAKLTIAEKTSSKPSIQFASTANGIAGAYLLNIKPGTKVYRYDVEIVKMHKTDATKNKMLTKRAPDDGEASLRKIFCTEVLSTFKSQTNNFGIGAKGNYCVYDGAKTLYLLAPMSLDAGKKRKDFTPEDLSQFCKNQLVGASVSIEICQSEQHEINISDVKSMLASRESTGDRSVAQFLDLLTSQWAVTGLTHCALGLGKLFHRQGEPMPNSFTMELKSGLNKGIQPIEKDGKINFCLVVDAKKTAFYRADYLHKILRESGALKNPRYDVPPMSQLYSGVRCSLKYAQNRTIVIVRIENDIAKNVKVNGGTLPQYFKKAYNIDVDPMLPVVKTDKAYYPMDCLIICPNQRVPMEKLDDNVRRTILSNTAVAPADRFGRIRDEVAAAKIVPGNAIMEFFGVKISDKMVDLTLGIRTAPTILSAVNGKQMNERVTNGGWKMSGLFAPTNLLTGGFIVLSPIARSQRDAFNPQDFTKKIITTASKHGLKLGNPIYEEVDLSNYEAMKPKFQKLMESKARFVLVYDTIRNKSHNNLKLLEREFQVLTMQVKIETAMRPGGSGQTLENLVLKINAKASGINVVPMIEKCGEELSLQKKVLVVGIDISMPTRGSAKELFELRKKELGDLSSHEPACVGITGNVGKQATTILGDYFFQPASHEVLDPALLKSNFSKMLDRFVKNRGFPDHIVVLRDGVGEGQLIKTTQHEYPVFENVVREMKGNNAFPNLVYMIVTKKHNKRIVLGPAGKEANPVSGTTCHKDFIRPDIPEFYLQSHRPLKGTAKIPHYSIMMNPKNVSMDALQAFVHHLCFNHQVVTSAVSLPEPIYHAKEMTKRGRNNLIAKRAANGGNVPRMANGLTDAEKVSAALSYNSIGLGNIKFAA